jgi:hypothetical protein
LEKGGSGAFLLSRDGELWKAVNLKGKPMFQSKNFLRSIKEEIMGCDVSVKLLIKLVSEIPIEL